MPPERSGRWNPREARDRLAAVAAAEGLSLRAYLARLAETVLTPAERAERVDQAEAALNAWTGCNPTAGGEAALDDELDRRLAQVQRPREATWAQAHAQHAAQPAPDRPDGAIVATTVPLRWKGAAVRVLDLNPGPSALGLLGPIGSTGSEQPRQGPGTHQGPCREWGQGPRARSGQTTRPPSIRSERGPGAPTRQGGARCP
ncbi:hypothetical protein SVEN_5750 [Streptomyces venezuelae ATCC 10712]|uniref:Uncharacterized protein n=1 Tax=Streptomyces venezuelae (strain ATCC 10712 / CBS 650.69 / DSM 40230 / JCM 4526 / NBRC 13096 / PD 04745) TaxID=953739 RepID=F2R9J3_STRVP|nr:hypothetical protein SVEN_5750 [Streptomyces venezuelae ATCC 10712]